MRAKPAWPPRRRPVQRERAEHLIVARYLDHLGLLWHHSPNGGRRNLIEAVMFKKMGTKAGFPDFAVFEVTGEGHVGLALELKADRGKPTDEQLGWLVELGERGWMTAVARGAQDAIRFIDRAYRAR